MNPWNQDQIFQGLQKLVPEIKCIKKLDDGSVYTSGEDACIFKGLPPFNHNLEYGELPLSDAGYTDSKYKNMKVKEMYVYGIHREIYNWLEERGWYPEWHDAGTLFLWKLKDDSTKKIVANFKKFHSFHSFRKNNGIENEILKKLRKAYYRGEENE